MTHNSRTQVQSTTHPWICWGSCKRHEVQQVLGVMLWKTCLPTLSPTPHESRLYPEQITSAHKLEIVCILSGFPPLHLQQVNGKEKKNPKVLANIFEGSSRVTWCWGLTTYRGSPKCWGKEWKGKLCVILATNIQMAQSHPRRGPLL